MLFKPRANDLIEIEGKSYNFVKHPDATGMEGLAHSKVGRYAIVYQLCSTGLADGSGGVPLVEWHALKVFKKLFQADAGLAGLADGLKAFAGLPGLQVCQRTVLVPHRHAELLQQYPELSYAMLMPWIKGRVWVQVVARKRDTTQEQSMALALSLASILSELERRGVAHCDLSGPNLIVRGLDENRTVLPDVVLVDVEQLYAPGLNKPRTLPKSSIGYAHRTSGDVGRWDALADRFAGAVLLAEMLGWYDPIVREASSGDTYFAPEEMQQFCARYELLLHTLKEYNGAGAASLFKRAWESSTLSDCPAFAEWLAVLSAVGAKPLRQWQWPPGVDDQVEIDGRIYTFTGHPAASGAPYAQEGRYSTVYQVRAAGMTIGPEGNRQQELGALKVFHLKLLHRLRMMPLFENGALAGPADGLQNFASLPGLQVCNRAVLSPQRHATVLQQHPNLTYAVLMPWIEGKTWSQVLQTKQPVTRDDSVMLARSLAEILNSLSARDAAHCDLSGANLIVQGLDAGRSPPPQVALVDVEQLYAPGLVRPDFLPQGSGGYAHHASGGLWDATADRFAGAVLLAEMMAWCDPITREAAWGNSYFAPDEMHTPCARYELLGIALIERGESAVANLFERAWQSESLAACPTFQEWLNALPRIAHSDPPEQGVDDTVKSTAPTAPGGKRSSASLTARMILLIVLLALIVTCLFFWFIMYESW